MRILVCGGRNYNNKAKVNETLYRLFPYATVIIHGGATGADTLADEWAITNWITVEEYKADWGKHGRAAGPIRKIAFPGGKGTAHMVKIAKNRN